jgi:hypothetical protein
LTDSCLAGRDLAESLCDPEVLVGRWKVVYVVEDEEAKVA